MVRKWLKKWWDRYRHFRAGYGLLQDILGFFGWKAALGAGAVAALTFVWARISRLALVEQFVLLLAAFAFVLVAINLAGRGFTPRSTRSRGGLQFGSWHGGVDSGYPAKVVGGFPSWLSVRNISVQVPKTAKNVTAQTEWINADRTQRFFVPEVDWYERHGLPGQRTTEAWTRQVSIEGGDEQSFVFLVEDENRRLWVYKHGSEPVGVLDYGRWDGKLRVLSDDAEGFEGTFGFTLTRSGLHRDSPFFVFRRRLKPTLA